jgi:uncharacterized protein (TIGR01777 family)
VSILVTGSSGLIGTALVDQLRKQGHGVTRLRRQPGPSLSGTTDVHWDPAGGTIDQEGLRQAGPFDGVVHLAGAGIGDRRWSPARKKIVHDSRTGSTQFLIGALQQLPTPPPVLVSGSAVGFYGDRGDEQLTEASSVGLGFLAGLCQAWEGAARPASEAGIRTVLLRTGIVISQLGGALSKQLPLFRLGLGGRTGTGKQYRSWITLEDEVGVILRCLEDDRLSGPVNATAPTPATDAELAKALGAALHRPAVLAVPAAALRLALGSEMAGELVLSGQRVLPTTLLAHDHRFLHTDVTEAVRSVLGAP